MIDRLISKLFPNDSKVPVLKMLIPVLAFLVVLFVLLIRQGQLQLFEPAGFVANIQSHLLWGALIFAAIVGGSIIVVFFVTVSRYQEHKRARYTPDWVAGKKLQLLGWGAPLLGVIAISSVVWVTAHQVDPYLPIASTVKPVNIQVVALRWKWLFIYPDDGLATVNQLEIPVGTPINLQLTADAPMNSFWIPRLSGQIYAMTGMVTQLHIQADQLGEYAGSPAEISGADFAGMGFPVRVVSPQDYLAWKTTAHKDTKTLDYSAYKQLSQPSSYVDQGLYALGDSKLFDAIVMQFMMPDTSTMQGMTM